MVVDEKLKKEMKKLRKKGYSYSKISLKLQISYQTVIYHLNEKFRESIRIKNKKYNKNQNQKKRREYFKKYQRERYTNDPEFREKQQERARENYRKNNKKGEDGKNK